ncbi:UNVERIFIED_CONTAM: NADH-ubiquinone oxidoreductase chain 4L [Sesamum calycinum]|uniref:NADH-ubiquinone oxidoreductase chain 4L n=1 Tax=Sesamum calycinum TaxID=2727403 RepID=A0AAW2KF35_9LAMI
MRSSLLSKRRLGLESRPYSTSPFIRLGACFHSLKILSTKEGQRGILKLLSLTPFTKVRSSFFPAAQLFERNAWWRFDKGAWSKVQYSSLFHLLNSKRRPAAPGCKIELLYYLTERPTEATFLSALFKRLASASGGAARPCCSVESLSQEGIRGILLNRRNIPIMSMPIESMLLAVNSNFLVFSVSSDDMMGQSFASLVSTVAAAESAIGLAIFVITFRVRGTIAVESINSIQGSGPFSLGEHIRF